MYYVEEIGNDNESYDLINVFDSNDELLVTYEDKRMYDYVKVIYSNELKGGYTPPNIHFNILLVVLISFHLFLSSYLFNLYR